MEPQNYRRIGSELGPVDAPTAAIRAIHSRILKESRKMAKLRRAVPPPTGVAAAKQMFKKQGTR